MIRLLLDHDSHGWLDIQIEHEGKMLEIPASFLSDGIGSLVSSLSLFAEGNKESVATVQTEPGEYRFVFRNTEDGCKFEIYEFDDNFHTGGLDKGTCVLSMQAERKKLLREFISEIRDLYELGNEEYERIWGFEFPTKSYERLLLAYKG